VFFSDENIDAHRGKGKVELIRDVKKKLKVFRSFASHTFLVPLVNVRNIPTFFSPSSTSMPLSKPHFICKKEILFFKSHGLPT
jgi:hypothetical protein